MRGKRAKFLRKVASDVLLEQDRIFDERKINVGRLHGGPAFERFPYPKSRRIMKVGDFTVVDTPIEEIRKAAGVDEGT